MMQQQLFLNYITLRFHLRQRSKQVPTPIFAVFTILGKTYRINTKVRVLPQHWHTATQRAIISSTFSNLDNENNLIANNRLNKIEFDFAEKKIYLCENFKCNYIYHLILAINPLYMARRKLYDNTSTPQQPTAIEVITTYLEGRVKAGSLKESSLERTYKPYISLLDKYIRDNCVTNDISVLDYNMMHKFCKYLMKTQTHAYAKRAIERIKDWLKDIEQENIGYVYDTNIDKIKIEVKTIAKKDKDYYALTIQEIERIYNLSDEQLSNTTQKRLAFYRDMFVMLCTTGARCSDIQKLFDSNNFDEETKTLTFEAKKNENKNVDTCIVPYTLYPMTLAIYQKYKDTTLHNSLFDSHNKFNEAIKELGRLASMDEIIKFKKNKKGGGIMSCEKAKYNLLTSHNGRHSFITNAIRHFGLSADEVIEITGHSDTQYITAVYSNLTDNDRRKRVVKTIEKATYKNNSNPIPTAVSISTPQQSTNTVVADVAEAYTVLNFLGANEDEYIGINDINQLIRLIGRYEGRILDKFCEKIDIEKLKELFNLGGKISERKKALHALFSEIALQQK
ncbi:MAG: hypothetical protein E7084_03560 [Bacteroidales bacterium]|nr:hypothetical protein [Bacteroidales bacterium]